jgi:molecular chaperone DnaK (HSP70)
MPVRWAIDLGTTNTVVAMEEGGSVRAIDLPQIGRMLPVEQSPLIPSAVHIYEIPRRWLFFKRMVRQVLVGQQALSRNFDGRSPAFAQSFKPLLASEPHRPILRLPNGRDYTVREVAQLFVQEVLASVRREFKTKTVDLTIPAPVGYFEQYRAELQLLARRTV